MMVKVMVKVNDGGEGIWCIRRRCTTINVELYFLSEVSVFIS